MVKVAVYAPIKPPDHPIASGDRLIARNLMTALDMGGLNPVLESSYIAYSKRPAVKYLRERKSGAETEAQAVLKRLSADPPSLWLTYHPYCKAPDWIGPVVARELDIPYVTLEACQTGQGRENGQDLWREWREEAQLGHRSAALHLCFKPQDRAYLQSHIGKGAVTSNIAPFFDAHVPDQLPSPTIPTHWAKDVPKLITVAMMRPGKKVENYQILANALDKIKALPWNLTIIGGGPEDENIRAMFDGINPARVSWLGSVEPQQVLSQLGAADLFVWPGWKEPIGMVYLEAQMMGLPVVAMKSMGVPLVVRHGSTGLLSKEYGSNQVPTELSDALATLISHPDLRRDFGAAASKYVTDHHSLPAAAECLKSLLLPLID